MLSINETQLIFEPILRSCLFFKKSKITTYNKKAMLPKENKALKYHETGRPGKTEVVPTKPLCTPEELALAHTPGATTASLGISHNRWNAYKYTNKGNLIAVISNGSSLPSIGNKGALAAKPLSEGKSMLYKVFADIDAFDIEIAQNDNDKLIETIQAMSPTFGGISLDGIEVRQSILLEESLSRLLDIPIMSDHIQGTNICIAVALKNATEITGRELKSLRIVINNCDAWAATTVRTLVNIGATQNNIKIFDSKGSTAEADLAQALNSADALIDLSQNCAIDIHLLQAMTKQPIIIALDINDTLYNIIEQTYPDAIIATSSTPNQINSLLASPYIFRAALDTLSTTINDAMIQAATDAIATLAHRPTPTPLQKMYGSKLTFGRNYFLPKAGDRRLATEVSVAVAKAAIKSGIARRTIRDWDDYCNILLDRLDRETRFCREIYNHYHPNKKLRRRYMRAIPLLKM